MNKAKKKENIKIVLIVGGQIESKEMREAREEYYRLYGR